MSKWEMVKLGEMLKIASGGTPSKGVPEYYKNGTIPWVKTGDLKGQYIDILSVDKITELGLNNSSAKVFPKHTVLIAMYGATIGATAILPTEASTNQACAAFLPSDRVSSEYLYYFLYSHKTKIISLGVGGAQPNISATILKQIEIPLPPLDEQKRIAEELDKISGLIAKRKSQLEKLDLLVKAKFVEIFGDPVTNPMGWKKENLSSLSEIKIGPFGSLLHKEDYVSNAHPLVNPSHIDNGNIAIDNGLTVSNEKYCELAPYHLKIGDIVLGRRGEMGRCAVVTNKGLLCGTGSLIIRPNKVINPYILQKIIAFPTFRKNIENMAVGVTMQNLNVPIVSNFQIPLYPMELQLIYIKLNSQTEQTKIKLQKGLEQLETLYKARMQEYFK